MMFRARKLSWMLWAGIAVSGCECGIPIGEDLRDAGRDGGTFRPRTDECGNGIDDDRNGRIDDGCVCGQGDVQPCFSGDYPGQGVGACRDGVQTCAVQEFGDWGMFSCTGETLPSPELCDGIDNDCDGARDEDCPCEVGATRMCSDEFSRAPCMPGTQTCRGGTWSRCEGAVAPSADVCSDSIDNDCDGTVNEGCECVSMPEQCNDRIDNDCDGEVDEVTCAPLPDAGMSLPDAGADAFIPPGSDANMSIPDAGPSACAEAETCGNRTDDDCDGRIDDGCEAGACPCAPADVRFERARIAAPALTEWSDSSGVLSAWSGNVHAFLANARPVGSPLTTQVSVLTRFDNAGVQLGVHVISGPATGLFYGASGLVWTGTSFVALLPGELVQIAEDGSVLRRVPLASVGTNANIRNRMAWNGRELGLLLSGSASVLGDPRAYFQRLDRDLNPIDPTPADITPASPALGNQLLWLGTRWLVTLSGLSADFLAGRGDTFLLMDGATVASSFTLDLVTDFPANTATDGNGHALTCTLPQRPGYDRSSPGYCYRIDEITGLNRTPTTITGGPFETAQVGVFWWRCSYVVVLPGNNDTPPDRPFDRFEEGRVVSITPDGMLTAIPRPLPDSGDPGLPGPNLNWHFHVKWTSVGYSPGTMFFPTRWYSPYQQQGRMSLSCGG